MMKTKMTTLTAVPAVFHKRLNVTRKALTTTTALVSAQRHLAIGIIGIGLLVSSPSYANPDGGKVVEGSATILQESAQKLNIQQHTDKAIIDWNSFNIGENEHTQFYQPNSNSIALNRITEGDPSQILGRLTANGRVMIINPNGVLFGRNSRIDVNGLVASTHDIKNHDFMNGNYNFNIPGNPKASIINKGNISVADQGLVAFVAPSVQNQGYIAARLGKVALASANGFTLDLYGDQLINILVDDKVAELALDENGEPVEALVDNSGKITADGGYVFLTVNAARSLVNKVVNNTGYLEARSVGVENGEIVLNGGDEGEVHVAGTVDASGDDTGETGGRIQITGEKVGIMAGADINASGESGGGTVLVGGDYLGGNGDPEIVKTYDIKLEDKVIPTAQFTYVDESAKISADAQSDGDGGKVIVWADQATRTYGEISAKGGANSGDGGFIETSGKDYLDVGQAADASAENGKGGTWLLDPRNVTITGAGVDANGTNSSNVFTATGDNATITATTIETALNAGTNIQINTGSTGAQDGNITLGANITKSAGGDATLTLVANKKIIAGGAYTISSTSNKLNMSFTAGEYNYLGWDASTETTLTSNGGDIYLDGGSYNILYGTVNAGAGDVTIKAANTPKEYGGLYLYTGSNIYGNNITVDTAGVIWDQDTGVDWSTSIEGTGNVTLKGSQIGTGSNSLQVVGGTNSTLTLEQTDRTNNTSTQWTYIYADKSSANRRFTTINATVRDNDVRSGLSIKFDGSTDRVYVRDDGTDIGTGTNYDTNWTPDYAIDTSQYNRNFNATTYGVKLKVTPYSSYIKTGTGTFTLNMYDQPSTTSSETQSKIDQSTANTTKYTPASAERPKPIDHKLQSGKEWIESLKLPQVSSSAPSIDSTLQMLFDSKNMTDVSVLNTFESADGSKYMELPDGSFALIKEVVINGATAKTPVHFENGRPLSENDKELLASGWSLEDVLNKSPQDVAVLLGKEKIQIAARIDNSKNINPTDQKSEEQLAAEEKVAQDEVAQQNLVQQQELVRQQEALVDQQLVLKRDLFTAGVGSLEDVPDTIRQEYQTAAQTLLEEWKQSDRDLNQLAQAYFTKLQKRINKLFNNDLIGLATLLKNASEGDPQKISERDYRKIQERLTDMYGDAVGELTKMMANGADFSNMTEESLINLMAQASYTNEVYEDVTHPDRGSNVLLAMVGKKVKTIQEINIASRTNALQTLANKNETYIAEAKSIYSDLLNQAYEKFSSNEISYAAYQLFSDKMSVLSREFEEKAGDLNGFAQSSGSALLNDDTFKSYREGLNDKTWELSQAKDNLALGKGNLFEQVLAEVKAAALKSSNNQGVGITGSGMAQFNGQLQDTSSKKTKTDDAQKQQSINDDNESIEEEKSTQREEVKVVEVNDQPRETPLIQAQMSLNKFKDISYDIFADSAAISNDMREQAQYFFDSGQINRSRYQRVLKEISKYDQSILMNSFDKRIGQLKNPKEIHVSNIQRSMVNLASDIHLKNEAVKSVGAKRFVADLLFNAIGKDENRLLVNKYSGREDANPSYVKFLQTNGLSASSPDYNSRNSAGMNLKKTEDQERFLNGITSSAETTQVAAIEPTAPTGGQNGNAAIGSSGGEGASSSSAQDEQALRRNPNGGKPQEPVLAPVGEDGIMIQTNPDGSVFVVSPDGQRFEAESVEDAEIMASNIQIQINAQKIAELANQNNEGAENQTGSELGDGEPVSDKNDGTQIITAEFNFGALTSQSGVKVDFSIKEIETIKGLIAGESAFTPNGEVLAQVASDIEFEGTNLREFLKKRAIGLSMYAAYQNEGKSAAKRLENALSDDTSIAVREKLDTLAEALTVEKMSAQEIAGDVFDSLVDRVKNIGKFALDFGSSLGDALIPEEALNAAFSSVETTVQVGQMQSSTIELIGLAAKGDIGELSKGVSDFIESAGNVALKDNKNFKAFKIAKAIAKMKESMSQANSLDTISENLDSPNGQGVYLNSVEKVMLKTKLYADAITNLTSALVDALPENIPGLDNLKIAQSVADSVSREANTQWNDEAALFNKTMDLRIEKGKQIGQAMVGVIEELQ
jgi:filamentous hemagglutinin family protein